ncbi:MAG TPA: 2,3-diaminopropionate biosynthesis protein SbnB [Blastocatellia bacterium]|nr:2,3-diaminopropionate biosynthesis protein SbnB [Blastocatellia bacterium]
MRRVLSGRELDIIEIVQKAYVSHARGESSLPHSVFLRFPDDARNRIIALPAYLGGEIDAAGVKWISSFPSNLEKGLDRASASIILNSAETGRPEAIMEGSIISAKRTAASAALAAKYLHQPRQANSVGLIGCGLINFEITRFLLAVFPNIERLVIFDLDRARADNFGQMCQRVFGAVNIEVAADINSVLRRTSLVSLATTTIVPHISDVSEFSPGSTILHISLRDLSPEVIVACDNIVDDPDHVCRAQTSVHLTEQQTGNRDFIRCTLGDIVTGTAAARKDDRTVSVFSPFGLGILDIAVACLVRDIGLREGLGLVVESFLPDPWTGAE